MFKTPVFPVSLADVDILPPSAQCLGQVVVALLLQIFC